MVSLYNFLSSYGMFGGRAKQNKSHRVTFSHDELYPFFLSF